MVMFICLNPSTADEIENDRTVNRCISFVQSWLIYGGLIITNLFAFRSKKARMIELVDDPIGNKNDSRIRKGHKEASITIAAWGNRGTHLNRSMEVRNMFENMYCLKINQTGEPAHPLRLPLNLNPKPL